jgi:Ca2+/H+ antiporter, TMEM165/GDT1 family
MGSLFAALGLVFIAEMGDKTQLVALGFGARHRLSQVLLGIAVAFAATSLIGVVVGGVLGANLPSRAIGIGGGVLFLLFAIWTLRSGDEMDDVSTSVQPARRGGAVWMTVAAGVFVAELGDKTMLATATLAADGSPVLVWIGSTIGAASASALGAVVGRGAGARLPQRAIRYASASLFAIAGLVLIVTNL